MYGDFEIEFRNIATAVTCPDCGKKYTVRLSIDYLVRHEGEELKVICLSCAQSRITEVNKTKVD